MNTNNLLISFSGGETSALMTWHILNGPLRDQYDDIRIVFANTGEEREETLLFVEQCQNHFGWDVDWIEAVVHHGVRKSCTYRFVDYATATRQNAVNGPFEQSIQKYGIPNTKARDCTKNLKQRPIESYCRDHLGWGPPGHYWTAIGIRADEIDRVSDQAEKRKLVYPLVDNPKTTKPMVNEWWRQQPFRLMLKGYEGNCAWCWKKSMRKHITLIRENRNHYWFPYRMERLYNQTGPEFEKAKRGETYKPLPEGYRRNFFRENLTVADIWNKSEELGDDFVPADDDKLDYEAFDPTLDVNAGCGDSCEVWTDYEDDEDDERD